MPTGLRPPKLAVERLREGGAVDAGAIDAFLDAHEIPIVEGPACTFLFRGEADEVAIVHRVVGLPGRLPLQRIDGSDLWCLVVELPHGSRVEYKVEVARDGQREQLDDPLNPRVAHNPLGTSSVCHAHGYEVPGWSQPDADVRPGSLETLVVPSRALQRDCQVSLYRPARYHRGGRYPLLVVHDGSDYLRYAAAKTVLDNLIHRLDVAELVAAFIDPGDRLVEYADDRRHARFVTTELVPRLEAELPLSARPAGRCLAGSSFGAVASLATAARFPGVYGALLLQSGSFVFTDIGTDHGGGEVFDPVVRLVNRYRARPRRVAERVHVSCGTYEPLIVRNRSMVPTFERAGMTVRYVEAPDGHNWENWRDRLRDALSWIYPGPHRYYYE